LLVLAVAFIATAVLAVGAGHAAGQLVAALPRTVLDVASLHVFSGDENEPDEREADDAPPAKPSQPNGPHSDVARWSAVAFGCLVIAAVVASVVVIAGWIRRYRAWKRRTTLEAKAWIRRRGDDIERVRRELRQDDQR
jgi:hypothetical protein